VEMIRVPPDPRSGVWTCGDDKTARRWRSDGIVDSDSTLRHRTSVWCVLPLADGRVVTGSGANNAMEVLQVWSPHSRDDPTQPGGFSRETQLSGHTKAVLDLAQLPDGRL
jgi:WD40 repeat protein